MLVVSVVLAVVTVASVVMIENSVIREFSNYSVGYSFLVSGPPSDYNYSVGYSFLVSGPEIGDSSSVFNVGYNCNISVNNETVAVCYELSNESPMTTTATTTWSWSPPPPPGINVSITAPGVMISSPGIYDPASILSLFVFLAIFIAYNKIARTGQALAVSAAISLMIAMISQNPYLIVLYILLFAVGIAMWKTMR